MTASESNRTRPGHEAAGSCEVCGSPTQPWLLGSARLRRCPSCGHLLRSLSDAPARHRDHAYGGDPALDAVRLTLTHRALVADGRPSSVFEVGYGAGALLRRFHDDGASIAGADPDQLEREVDPVVVQHATLHHCGIEDVDASEDHVDMVYGIHVLEHVVDPLTTLRRSVALLRPGGTAHFFTPAGDWAGLPLYRDGWWMLEDPTHIRFFTADSLARLAREAGFVDVEVRRPMLDSLVNDAASAVRRFRPTERAEGVLAHRSTMALAAATLPATVLARAVAPRMRPTLHLVGRTGS